MLSAVLSENQNLRIPLEFLSLNSSRKSSKDSFGNSCKVFYRHSSWDSLIISLKISPDIFMRYLHECVSVFIHILRQHKGISWFFLVENVSRFFPKLFFWKFCSNWVFTKKTSRKTSSARIKIQEIPWFFLWMWMKTDIKNIASLFSKK